MSTNRFRLMILIAMAMLLPVISYAQIDMTIKRIVPFDSTVEVYFSTFCSTTPTRFDDKGKYSLFENGVEITNFSIDCQDNPAVSIVLAADNRGGMIGAPSYYCRDGMHALLNRLDSTKYDVSLMLFGSDTILFKVPLTNKYSELRDSIDQYWSRFTPFIPNGPDTAHWSIIHGSIEELKAHANNNIRVVIMVAQWNYWIAPNTIYMNLARSAQVEKVHVYSIYMGLGTYYKQIDTLSVFTGGRDYGNGNHSVSGDMTSIFEDIYNHIQRGFDECMLTYKTGCPDGSVRHVELRYKDYCNNKLDSDVAYGTYTAPLDSSAFVPLDYGLKDVKALGGDTIDVSLELTSAIQPGTEFSPATIRLQYDTTLLGFLGIPGDTLLCGAPVTSGRIPGGVELRIPQPYTLDAPGVLARLRFTTVVPEDTVVSQVRFESWANDAGCYTAVTHDGTVTLNLRFDVRVFAGPNAPLVCSRDSAFYRPNPFQITFAT